MATYTQLEQRDCKSMDQAGTKATEFDSPMSFCETPQTRFLNIFWTEIFKNKLAY